MGRLTSSRLCTGRTRVWNRRRVPLGECTCWEKKRGSRQGSTSWELPLEAQFTREERKRTWLMSSVCGTPLSQSAHEPAMIRTLPSGYFQRVDSVGTGGRDSGVDNRWRRCARPEKDRKLSLHNSTRNHHLTVDCLSNSFCCGYSFSPHWRCSSWSAIEIGIVAKYFYVVFIPTAFSC